MRSRSPLAVLLVAALVVLSIGAPVAAAWALGDCEVCCCGPRPDVSVAVDDDPCGCEVESPSEFPPGEPLTGDAPVVVAPPLAVPAGSSSPIASERPVVPRDAATRPPSRPPPRTLLGVRLL